MMTDGSLPIVGPLKNGPASRLHMLVEAGRTYHRKWCERTFAPALVGLRGARRERRVAQLVVVTDIYTWKLLRRDRGLSAKQTKLAICELLEPLMERSS